MRLEKLNVSLYLQQVHGGKRNQASSEFKSEIPCIKECWDYKISPFMGDSRMVDVDL